MLSTEHGTHAGFFWFSACTVPRITDATVSASDALALANDGKDAFTTHIHAL